MQSILDQALEEQEADFDHAREDAAIDGKSDADDGKPDWNRLWRDSVYRSVLINRLLELSAPARGQMNANKQFAFGWVDTPEANADASHEI